jgi:hypothetical protein
MLWCISSPPNQPIDEMLCSAESNNMAQGL